MNRCGITFYVLRSKFYVRVNLNVEGKFRRSRPARNAPAKATLNINTEKRRT